MKYPSLSDTLKLLKPYTKETDPNKNSSQVCESRLDKNRESTSPEQGNDLDKVSNFEQQTEIQQQQTIIALIEHKRFETLEVILRSKYNINFLLSGQTPLHFAIKDQNLAMVSLLLKFNADCEFVDIYKETALNCAVRVGNMDVIKYLLEHGAEVNTHASDNTTPLEFAIRNRDAACVDVLKKYGAHLGDSHLKSKLIKAFLD